MVCCGLTTLDLTYVVDAPPRPDEKVVARDLRVDVGGPAANAARVVAALGGRATLVTALGTGGLADLIRARLGGLAVVDLAPATHQPAVSTVMVAGAHRAVVSVNATALRSATPPPDVPDADALLVDGHLMSAGILLAASMPDDVPVILDGGSWKPGMDDLLAHTTIAAVSEDFRVPGAEHALEALRSRGVAVALRTHGADPVELLTQDGATAVPVPVVDAIDTLGAGDVFHGALAWAVAGGVGPTAAVRTAVAVASGSVAHPGVLGWVRPERG